MFIFSKKNLNYYRIILLIFFIFLIFGCASKRTDTDSLTNNNPPIDTKPDTDTDTDTDTNTDNDKATDSDPITTTVFSEVFRDDFNGTELDMSKWSHDNCSDQPGCGNSERQTYQPQNVIVSNGKLKIIVTHEGGQSYTSGKIQTKDLHSWTYGRFEIRAKLPNSGQGLWPAIWLLADACKYFNYIWPKCGEIDIMERVNLELSIHSTTHTECCSGENGRGNSQSITDFTPYYIFALEWDNNAIKFFIRESSNNNNPIELDPVDYSSPFYTITKNNGDTFNEWPFDHPFFLILNVAVGGDWPEATGLPDSSTWGENPTHMVVDYVRILQKTQSSSPQNAIDFPETPEILISSNVTLTVSTGQAGQTVHLFHNDNDNNWNWPGQLATDNGDGTYSIFNFQITNQTNYKWVKDNVEENFSTDSSVCPFNSIVDTYSNRQWDPNYGTTITDEFNVCRTSVP